MQLVSNYGQTEDVAETEPILNQSDTVSTSKEFPSSCEIRLVIGDSSDAGDDRPSLDGDECCNLVNVDQPQCRICLDNGGEDLIAPCYCRGTQKYVHRSCLDHWRSTKEKRKLLGQVWCAAPMPRHRVSEMTVTPRYTFLCGCGGHFACFSVWAQEHVTCTQEGFAFAHCTECRAVFILRANVPADRWWLRLKFQLLVVRDHAFIFIVVQLVVAFLGMLVYKFYGEELREMFGYEEHPYGFYAMAVSAIVLVGLLYGFFIAIICGQRINERHYHVLAKQELTKEYVVEDREDNKNHPELDASHITELRMLGLY